MQTSNLKQVLLYLDSKKKTKLDFKTLQISWRNNDWQDKVWISFVKIWEVVKMAGNVSLYSMCLWSDKQCYRNILSPVFSFILKIFCLLFITTSENTSTKRIKGCHASLGVQIWMSKNAGKITWIKNISVLGLRTLCPYFLLFVLSIDGTFDGKNPKLNFGLSVSPSLLKDGITVPFFPERLTCQRL